MWTAHLLRRNELFHESAQSNWPFSAQTLFHHRNQNLSNDTQMSKKCWFLWGEHCRSQRRFKMGLKVVCLMVQPTFTHNAFLCVGPETFLCISAGACIKLKRLKKKKKNLKRVRDTSLEKYQRSESMFGFLQLQWLDGSDSLCLNNQWRSMLWTSTPTVRLISKVWPRPQRLFLR